MLSLRLLPSVSSLAAAPSTRKQAHPVVCHYRAADDHREERYWVYTATDAQNGGLSPASQAVLIGLIEKDLPFNERRVTAQGSQEVNELFHSIVPDKDVKERVPVLVKGTKRLVEPAVIVEYLAAAYPDSGTPLAPPDPYAAARVKLFTQYFMDHVVPAFSRLTHVEGADQIQEAKGALLKALGAVDQFLLLHGGGEGEYAVGPHYGWSMTGSMEAPAEPPGSSSSSSPHEHYLMGPFFTTAEVLCTPYVARMVYVLPEWRNFDVLQEAEDAQLHRVAGWMRACLKRPSAQKTAPGRKELVQGLVEWEFSHAM